MTQANRVSMVQMTQFRWNLVSPTGSLLVDSILFPNRNKAEEWATAYISSFPSWSLILIPLKGAVPCYDKKP